MSTSEYAVHTGGATRTSRTADPTIRTYGRLCLAGGVIAAVGAVSVSLMTATVASDRISYPLSAGAFRFTEVIWTITHVLTFFGALGLVRTGFAGRGRLGRVGTPMALVGMALLVPAELAFVLAADEKESAPLASTLDSAIGIVAIVAAIGFTLLGVAVVRERRWTGWGRWTPLVVGLWGLVVLTPAAPAGEAVFTVAISGWNVCLAVLGLALRPWGHGR